MRNDLKQIECDPSCGFLVRSHNDKEVIKLATDHVKKVHPEKKITQDMLHSMIKAV